MDLQQLVLEVVLGPSLPSDTLHRAFGLPFLGLTSSIRVLCVSRQESCLL